MGEIWGRAFQYNRLSVLQNNPPLPARGSLFFTEENHKIERTLPPLPCQEIVVKNFEQIQARNAILSEYNLATDEKVKPAHRKEFLGVLMLRAAEQGNVLLMDSADHYHQRGPHQHTAKYSRLACVALGLVTQHNDLVCHVLQEIPDYANSPAFSSLLNMAAETTDLALFDRTWSYVKNKNIPLRLREFDFIHRLAGRNEWERLMDVNTHLNFTSEDYVTVGQCAIRNHARDVVEKFVLSAKFDKDNYLNWMEACSELEPGARFVFSEMVVNSVPTPKRHEFIIDYVHHADYLEPYALDNVFLELTKDVAAHCDRFTATQKNSIISSLNAIDNNEHAEELKNLLSAQRVNANLRNEIKIATANKSAPPARKM